jgi:hypothetical protein
MELNKNGRKNRRGRKIYFLGGKGRIIIGPPLN